MVKDFYVRLLKCIRKYPQWFDPGFWYEREWKSLSVVSLVYIIRYYDYDSNLDTDEIRSLIADCYAEYYMDALSIFHMRYYYALNLQSKYPYTLIYMETLSGEHVY